MNKVYALLVLAILSMALVPSVIANEVVSNENQARRDARWEEIRAESRAGLQENHIWFSELRCYVWGLQIKHIIEEANRYGISQYEKNELFRKVKLSEQHC